MSRSLACALLLSTLLSADEVWLTNGQLIEGKVVVDRPDRIVVETGGGRVTIARDQVERVIRRAEAPPPEKDGAAPTHEQPTPPQPKPPEPKPPEPKSPKEPTKPPTPKTSPPSPPPVEPQTPTQREFLDLLGKAGEANLPEEQRARLQERLGELASQDLGFTMKVFDAGPVNRTLSVLSVLVRRKDPLALEALEKRLTSSDPSLRAAIVSSFGSFEGSDHIARLRDRYAKEDPLVQTAILDQWERRAYVEATEDVLPSIVSGNETVRKRALSALGRFASVHTTQEGGAYDLSAQVAGMWAEEEATGPLALPLLQLLSDIGGPKAVESLTQALTSDVTAQREEAARGLGRLQARGATAELLAAAEEDEERRVRMAAVKAIELVKDPAATERLIALLETDDADLRAAVHRALKVITNQTLGPTYDEWAGWWEAQH